MIFNMKKMKTMRLSALCVMILTLVSGSSLAYVQLQSQASINQAVKEFVLKQHTPLKDIQTRITSSLKKRNLQKCSVPLQVKRLAGAKLLGRTNFTISCQSPQMWKIHVAAHVDGKVNVLVAKHPISQKSLVQQDDLKYSSRLYSELKRGYYVAANKIINMETRRNIIIDQVLTPNMLSAQKLVLRGQHITIIATNGSLNLSVKGKSLMDGERGQTIRVRNLSSDKLVYAQVISAGTVKVTF